MAPHPQRLTVIRRAWPLAQPFAISRGTKTVAEVVVAEVFDGEFRGRGECVPYPRYGESIDSVAAALEAMKGAVFSGLDRHELQRVMQPGAARNALDCAFWDLDAKRDDRRVADLAGIATMRPVVTAYTLGLDTPERMGEAAALQRHRPLLKLKLTGDGDIERVRAVRAAAPRARLIVDPNEGWRERHLAEIMPALAQFGVVLIEQPLPAGADDALASVPHPIPICADEACHTTDDLDRLVGKYDAVNIKLDKTGGLTEALALTATAKERGFTIMVGCMIGTSLAMAPALLIAQQAEIVDLDAPLLLAADRVPGLRYDGSTVHPPDPVVGLTAMNGATGERPGDRDVLIVTDPQRDFCPGGALAVPQGDAIIPTVNRLARRFPHVVITQDWHPPDHVSFAGAHPDKAPFETITLDYGPQTLWPAHCVQGTPGASFHPDLDIPHAELIIRKGFHRTIDSYSAFRENDRRTPTGLAGYLRERGFMRVTICGLATDFCVLFSAIDAAEAGFAVTVDLEASRALDLDGSLAQALAAMRGAGIMLR